MALLAVYSKVRREVSCVCEVASSQGKRTVLAPTDRPTHRPTHRVSDPPTLTFWSNAELGGQSEFGKLVFRIKNSEIHDSTDSSIDPTHDEWTSPHHDVSIQVTGDLGDTLHHRQLPARLWSAMLYDLCYFATRCGELGMYSLCVQCDCTCFRAVVGSDGPFGINHKKFLSVFLPTTIIFTFLLRLSSERQMIARLSESGSVQLRFNEDSSTRSPIMHTCIYKPDDDHFVSEFKSILSSSIDVARDVYLCIMFNEIDTCLWYLQVKGIEKQRHRLPTQDITRIRLMSDSNRLTVQVTTFDADQKNCYTDTGPVTVDEMMQQFSDDQFLLTVLPVCKQCATVSHSFHLECFTVPCRTTLHFLESINKNDRLSAVPQSEDQEGNSAPRSFSPPGDPLLSVDLFQSAAKGELTELQQILESSSSLVQKLSELSPHRSALLCAASASVTDFSQGAESHTEYARLLLKHGADPHATDSRKHTVLHCAVLADNAHLLEQLLEMKLLDVNCKDENDKTPLLLAVEHENPRMTKLLLDHGAVCDSVLDTALTAAVTSGAVNILQIMLDHECSLLTDKKFLRFVSLYQSAWNAGHRNICIFLISRQFNMTEDSIYEAVKLSSLICLGKLDELLKLLTTDNCNYRDWKLRTPLMWAAIGCWKPTDSHTECARSLIHVGADVSATDLECNTPLHYAAAAGNLTVVRLLLEAGASASFANLQGETPLDLLRNQVHTAVMQTLTDQPSIEQTNIEMLIAKAEHLRDLWQRFLEFINRSEQEPMINEVQMMHLLEIQHLWEKASKLLLQPMPQDVEDKDQMPSVQESVKNDEDIQYEASVAISHRADTEASLADIIKNSTDSDEIKIEICCGRVDVEDSTSDLKVDFIWPSSLASFGGTGEFGKESISSYPSHSGNSCALELSQRSLTHMASLPEIVRC